MIPRSIRWRILLGITLPAILILVAASLALHLWIRAESFAHLDNALETRAAAMAALVEFEGGQWDVDFDGDEVPVTALFGPLAAYEVRVVEDGLLLAQRSTGGFSSSAPADEKLPDVDALPRDRPLRVSGAAATITASGTSPLRTWSGIFVVRADEGESDQDVSRPREAVAAPAPTTMPAVRIVVAQDLGPISAELRSLLRTQLKIGIGLSGLAVFFGWLLSRRIVDPIEAMADRAESVHAPSPEPPLPVSGSGDEIDRLAEALNRSFGRLHEAYSLQARFTADASHELRTPLAVIRSQAEVALRRPRPVPHYEDALAAIVIGSCRMQDILDGLLLLARTDAGAVEQLQDVVDLCALARAVLDAHPAAPPGLVLRFDGPAEAHVAGDRQHLEFALRNLVSNAIRHTPPPGEVLVRVAPEAGHLVLEVRDTGEGIPPDALPHIFDRFFRADAARTRDRGGSGLGLSIVKVVVEQHGGSVHATSTLAKGTTLRVRLPWAGRPPLADEAAAGA